MVFAIVYKVAVQLQFCIVLPSSPHKLGISKLLVGISKILVELARGLLTRLSLLEESASWKFFDSTCAYFKELSFSRLRELYERLDMDNDGTVDIRDLTAALKREMPHIPERLAPVRSVSSRFFR